MTQTNLKQSEGDRVTAVIQLATSSTDEISYQALSCACLLILYLSSTLGLLSTLAPKGISLTFKGTSYPDPITNEPTTQSFQADILCDTAPSDPTLKSYDGKKVWIEWKAQSGCMLGSADPPPDSPPKDEPEPGDSQSVGSGIGWFFLL